jgi:hypothetical protein
MGSEIERVKQALELVAMGEIEAARKIAADLPQVDREAIEAGVRAALNEKRRRRLEQEQERAAAISTPAVPVSEAVRSRVKAATSESEKAAFLQRAAMGDKGKRKIPAKIRAKIREHEARARRLLLEAEGITKSEEEAAWLDGAVSESVALAELRGEHVADLPVAGTKARRRVMMSRGAGLEHARDNGYLADSHGRDETDDLYRVGQTYRDAFEIVEGRVTRRAEPGQGGGAFGPKGPQIAVSEANQVLATMRGPLSAKQRAVLDHVCGEGGGLWTVGKALGMGAPAARNALRGGLKAALDALKAAAKARRTGEAPDLAADRQAVSRAISEAGRGL